MARGNHARPRTGGGVGRAGPPAGDRRGSPGPGRPPGAVARGGPAGPAAGRLGAPPAGAGERLRRIPVRCGPEPRGALRIMAHLLDTNILVRLANTADASHAVAARAVVELHRRGEAL